MKQRTSLLLLFLLVILLVAGFLRFYRLGVNPPGLFKDEAFFGDLAYCLLSTGRDFEGVSWPLSSFGHGASILPLQLYPMVVSVFVFGFDVFAVRFVPALLGVLIVLVTFLLARFLFNDFVGLLSAFLVAVSPWHVVYSRVGFGILQLTFFFSLGLYLFLRGLKGDGRLMVLGGFCFGLTFFSYYLAHVFAPLFLFGIHYLVYNEVKSSGKERLYYLLLFILILFLLLSLTTPYLGKISLLLVDNIPNAVSNFSELLYSVFLLKGNWSWPPYSGVFGVVYPVCIPLLVLGLVLLVWNRNFQSTLILYWLFLAFFLNAFISSASTGSLRRVFTCAGPVFEIVVAYAVYRILVFYSASRKVFWLLFGLFSIGLLLGIYPFLVHYFVYQPVSIEAEKVFMVPVKDLFNYTESVKDRYDKIIITDRFVVLEDYVFFYTKTRLNDSTYVLGNVSSYPPGNRTLFVVRDYELANVTPKKIFYYSNGEVAYKVVE